jgi:tetratricopeptide (TPR) repeat protein
VTRYLSLLLGLGLDERARETIELQYATRRLFEQLAERAPMMTVFDDLHWADDASLDLISYLSSHLQDQPVVILVLARPELFESRPNWGAGLMPHTSLPLNPLSPHDASEAVKTLLTRAETSTIARIVAVAEGNPLFIEELAASIQDDAGAEVLPATIRAVIVSRIDALPADARSLLLRASVIGKTFWRGILGEVAGTSAIDAALGTLEARRFIQQSRPSRVEGDTEFTFKHDLIREAAYATLPRAARRELHQAIARALETLAEYPAEIGSILAHHWSNAGDAERACGYLLTAAERARDALAVEETYDLYTQALTLAADENARTHIEYLRGLALVQLQDYSRAARELAVIIPQVEGGQKIEAVIARARATLWTEQTDETMAGAELALQLARADGFKELEAVALGLLGSAHGMRGEAGDLTRALRLGDQALNLWTPNTRRAELAEFHHLAANHYYWAGDYGQALEASRLSAATAGVELHSQEFRLRGAGMQAIVLAGMGRYEEAISAADDALQLARAIGRPMNVVMNYSTLPLREIFALDEALARSEEVADRLGPSDFNMPWMNARADVFTACVIRDDLARAESEWGSVWDDAVASKAWERWLVSGRLAAARADMELSMGHTGEALVWARRAIDLAVASSRKKYEAIGRTTAGRALIGDGLYDEAATELRRAVAVSDALSSPLLRWQSRAALAQALARTGHDPGPAYHEAATIIRDVADSLSAEHAAGYLAAPQVASVSTP